jgi:hypothetical protein
MASALPTTISTLFQPLYLHYSNMSSPHYLAAAALATDSSGAKTTFGSSKTVYLGAERRALSIQSLVPVTAPSYMKQAGFSRLVSTLKSHNAVHSCADLMAVISDELPISTASATSEASTVCDSIFTAAFRVPNLTPCVFYDDLGNIVRSQITFEPATRPANITFVNFSCKINGKSFDARIQQPEFGFNFSLRLPQTEMNVPIQSSTRKKNTIVVDDTEDPAIMSLPGDDSTAVTAQNDLLATLMANAKATNSDISNEDLNAACLKFLTQVSPSKKTVPTTTDGFSSPSTRRNLFSTVPTVDPSISLLDSLSSPKMKKLIQCGTTDSNQTHSQYSYYGSLAFVDEQHVFDSVFGPNPTMLQVTRLSQINSDSGSDSISSISPAIKHLHTYIEKCHFDVFVEICKMDYVGLTDPASDQKATQEICKKISSLNQVQTQKNNNKQIILHPAQLFEEFLNLVPSLPDNAAAWSIILCRSFYDSLTQELRDRLDEDEFVLPDMTSLTSKQAQLHALRIVKEAASHKT